MELIHKQYEDINGIDLERGIISCCGGLEVPDIYYFTQSEEFKIILYREKEIWIYL